MKHMNNIRESIQLRQGHSRESNVTSTRANRHNLMSGAHKGKERSAAIYPDVLELDTLDETAVSVATLACCISCKLQS